jgi:hypothetical protein
VALLRIPSFWKRSMDLTDEQWQVLEPLLSSLPRREDDRERP